MGPAPQHEGQNMEAKFEGWKELASNAILQSDIAKRHGGLAGLTYYETVPLLKLVRFRLDDVYITVSFATGEPHVCWPACLMRTGASRRVCV